MIRVSTIHRRGEESGSAMPNGEIDAAAHAAPGPRDAHRRAAARRTRAAAVGRILCRSARHERNGMDFAYPPVMRRSSSRRRAAVLGTALVAMSAVQPARAQEAAAARLSPWQFELTPYGWFAGLSGTLHTPLRRFPERNVDADFGSIVGDISGIPIMGTAEV